MGWIRSSDSRACHVEPPCSTRFLGLMTSPLKKPSYSLDNSQVLQQRFRGVEAFRVARRYAGFRTHWLSMD